MTKESSMLTPETLRGNWSYPTSIRFGVGRIAELAEACKASGIERPLLVTDPGLAGLYQRKSPALGFGVGKVVGFDAHSADRKSMMGQSRLSGLTKSEARLAPFSFPQGLGGSDSFFVRKDGAIRVSPRPLVFVRTQ